MTLAPTALPCEFFLVPEHGGLLLAEVLLHLGEAASHCDIHISQGVQPLLSLLPHDLPDGAPQLLEGEPAAATTVCLLNAMNPKSHNLLY